MFTVLVAAAVAVVASVVSSYVLSSRGNKSPSIDKLTEDDLSMPTVKEGGPLAVVFGTRDIDAPIVGWYGNLQGDNESGYTLGMHLVLCQAMRSIRLKRISWGEKCCWLGDLTDDYLVSTQRSTINQNNLFSDGNGISGSFSFYSGNGNGGHIFSYYLEPFIKVGAAGWGNLGMTSVVFEDINLGSSPSLRNPSFRVQRTLTGWYDEKAEIIPQASEFISIYGDSTWSNGNRNDIQRLTLTFVKNPLIHSRSVKLYEDPGVTPVSGTLNFQVYINSELAYTEVLATAFEHQISFEILPKYLKVGTNEIRITMQSDARYIGGLPYSRVYREQTTVDMNPVHAIRECLTSTVFGMGYTDSDIDSDSFTACADKLYTEQMGISVKWSKSSTIEDFLKEILRHIDAVLYVDRKTGKFKLKLIRKDYDLTELLVFDKTNVSSVENWKRTAFDDLQNTVQVTYYNTALGGPAGITVSDVALVQEQGMKNQASIDFPAFSNEENAKRAALRELAIVSSPILSCTVNANADALGLDIGDVFLLDWPKYEAGQIPMRIYKMNFGDGTKNIISIDCVEDKTIY